MFFYASPELWVQGGYRSETDLKKLKTTNFFKKNVLRFNKNCKPAIYFERNARAGAMRKLKSTPFSKRRAVAWPEHYRREGAKERLKLDRFFWQTYFDICHLSVVTDNFFPNVSKEYCL